MITAARNKAHAEKTNAMPVFIYANEGEGGGPRLG
jgi:hypothetical protein